MTWQFVCFPIFCKTFFIHFLFLNCVNHFLYNYYLSLTLSAGPVRFIFVGCIGMFTSDDLLGRRGGG